MNEYGRLVIHRAERFTKQDNFRAYTIEVDGAAVGKIKRGETTTIPLEPGSHTVRAAVKWCGSPMVTVEVTPGQNAEFEVAGSGNLDSATGPDAAHGYLVLNPVDAS